MKESIPKKEIAPLGTIENPIIDSDMSLDEALKPNPEFKISPEIFEKQALVPIVYISFDGKYHQGQVVVNMDLAQDVIYFFEFLLKQKFPLSRAIPIANEKYNFSDSLSMADNNSSGFNPRFIAGTQKLSLHAFGRALDINPLQNPYMRENITEPAGAFYNIERYGTITPEIAEFLKKRGWRWGGDWHDFKDYQHLEKLEEKESE